MTLLSKEWFTRDAVEVARDLIGKVLRHGECQGIIVETEAYTSDAASHGRVLTERSRLMHETYGQWYVYFTYGMHYCANVTSNKDGVGAVLIRAVRPTEGIEQMRERRGGKEIHQLCNGPAKLCQAFAITKAQNGLPLNDDFGIFDASTLPDSEIIAGPRIGIKKDTELPWRFSIEGSAFVSR